MSTNALKALWCVLDADDSNQIHLNEMAAFLKRARRRWCRGTAGVLRA